MFKIAKLSFEALMFFTILGFLAVWVVLQEYGTVLIWLLILFLIMKIVKHIKDTKVIGIYYPSKDDPTYPQYPHHGVSKPVAIDRYTMLERPLDRHDPKV